MNGLSVISIHLMFLLILAAGAQDHDAGNISIHLMFLLIISAPLALLVSCHFNTSHVSINPIPKRDGGQKSEISIHLMFLLIQKGVCWNTEKQYFNTSHVSINHR